MSDSSEQRRSKRKFFTVTFEMAYAALEQEHLKCQNSVGISTNISEGGIGFLTNQSLHQGTEIKLYNNRIASIPKNAEVRWCVRISDSLFKVGACFN